MRDEVLALHSADEAVIAVGALLQTAHRQVDIQSPLLDPALYDTEEICACLRRLVVDSGRRTRVRILVADPGTIVRRGHRLLALSRQLTSFITIRQLAEEDVDDGGFLIVDRGHYLRWEPGTGYQGSGRRNNRGHTARWSRLFSERWDRAVQPAALRRLYL